MSMNWAFARNSWSSICVVDSIVRIQCRSYEVWLSCRYVYVRVRSDGRPTVWLRRRPFWNLLLLLVADAPSPEMMRVALVASRMRRVAERFPASGKGARMDLVNVRACAAGANSPRAIVRPCAEGGCGIPPLWRQLVVDVAGRPAASGRSALKQAEKSVLLGRSATGRSSRLRPSVRPLAPVATMTKLNMHSFHGYYCYYSETCRNQPDVLSWQINRENVGLVVRVAFLFRQTF